MKPVFNSMDGKSPGISGVDLSIVIVSWNVSAFLRQCLESIDSQHTRYSYEVIVVDNASQDGSAAMVREQCPQVKLIENTDNLGFAAANNVGLQHCAGRILLLLNPDTVLLDGALDQLAGYLEANPECGAAGPRLLNADGSLQPSCYPFPRFGREFWRLLHLDRIRPVGVYDMAGWSLDRPAHVDALKGACLLVRREALDQSGPLDLDYFMYTEEIDLCFRLRKAGWQIAWVPQAQVVHYGGESTQQVSAQSFLHLYQSKSLYFKKNHGAWAAAVYRLILLFGSLLRLLLVPAALLEKRSQRVRHLQLARNYVSLIRALVSPSF